MPRNPCDPLAKSITELAMHLGTDPKIKTLDDLTKAVQQHVPEITRESLAQSINEATTGYTKAANELRDKLAALKREARSDVRLRAAITEVEGNLRAGTPLSKKKPAKEPPKTIQELRDRLDALKAEVAMADPAKREAVRRRIAELDKYIADGTVPPARETKAAPADLQALRDQRDSKLREAKKPGQKAETIASLKDQIKELDKHIAAGTMPPKSAPKATDPEIQALRDQRNAKMREAANADPATREKLRQQIAELNEHIKNKTVPAKEAKQTPPADVAKLREERDRLAAQMRKFDPARVDAAKARIAELEQHLKNGTLPKSEPAMPEPNQEVAALNDSAEQLRKALRQSDPALKQRYEKAIDDLTNRLENGVYSPVAAQEVKLRSPQIERLAYERDRLRNEINRRIQAQKQPETRFGRAVKKAQDARNVVRQFVVGGDFGVIFRQGGISALAHPAQHLKSMKVLAQAVKDPIKAREIMQGIEDSPWRVAADRAGLKLSQIDGVFEGPTFKEEGYGSALNRIAPARAIERGNQVFLNKLRFDRFSAMAETLAKGGEPTLAELKAIAEFANQSTGAGTLESRGMRAIKTFADKIMFSPSYQMSRFQMLTGNSLFGGSWRTRKLIAKEYARTVIGGGVLVTIASQMGFKIGTDERSSDFGKIILPDGTRIDPWSGLAQYVVLGGRMVSGESVSRAGKVSPLTGPKARRTRLDTLGTFVRGKLDPTTGLAVDLLSNQKNVIGEDVGVEDIPNRLILPLSYQDVYGAFRDDDIDEATAKALLTMMGVGVQSPKK